HAPSLGVAREVGEQRALPCARLAAQHDHPALTVERVAQQTIERSTFLGSTEELRRLGGGDTAHVDLLGARRAREGCGKPPRREPKSNRENGSCPPNLEADLPQHRLSAAQERDL